MSVSTAEDIIEALGFSNILTDGPTDVADDVPGKARVEADGALEIIPMVDELLDPGCSDLLISWGAAEIVSGLLKPGGFVVVAFALYT